jgi:hypothetical protein
MKHSYHLYLSLWIFALLAGCVNKARKILVIDVSKDTFWLYPSHFNPLKSNTKILIAIESDLDSNSYMTFDNTSSKLFTFLVLKKEKRLKFFQKGSYLKVYPKHIFLRIT